MMSDLKNHEPKVSLDSLKGMQSVRATFTLPKNAIKLLSAVANQLGVKQKSIFDHLVENRQILDQVADEAQDYEPSGGSRKQKTFVLSRNSLTTLGTFAKTYKLPRDLVVEFSIQQLRPVIDAEKEKHENRKTLLAELSRYLEFGHQLLDKAHQQVGEEEPACRKLEYVLKLQEKNIDELTSAIEKGKRMENLQ